MKKYKMPVGAPTRFEGDIRLVDPKAFGYFYCEIVTPHFLKHPLLQRRVKTKDGIRTIAGLGKWKGWV